MISSGAESLVNCVSPYVASKAVYKFTLNGGARLGRSPLEVGRALMTVRFVIKGPKCEFKGMRTGLLRPQ